MIEVEGLTKRFGPILAVDDLTFATPKGEVLGFLGPNGSGKSTTMKMITGYLTPTAGTVRVCGIDSRDRPIELRKRIGYLPEGAPLYADMTPRRFLRFVAQVHDFRGADANKAVDRAVDLTGLAQVTDQPIDTLSKGYKRRVGVAQALIHDPEVLILDEPTDGLDPNQKHEVRELIRGMASEKTIILSTHILEEVEALCTRAIIIARGRIVASGTPADLEARSRYHNAVSLRLGDGADPDAVRRSLAGLAGVAEVETPARRHFLALAREGRPILDDILRLGREQGWPMEEMVVERGRLDEVFRTITRPAA